ncbi:MAG: VanZ family protein [Roseburia sp.]|nr:VanZ family protein [Roseburia sp.]
MAVNKRKSTGIRAFAIVLFFLYFVVLFYFLFFSEEMGRTYSEREYHYNLIPFHEIKRFIHYYEVLGMEAVILNLVGNVVAFMPFGFFLPVFATRCRTIWNTLLYSFELSVLVELIQLITKVGSFDVDDIILNTLGGILGYIVYKIVRRWWYRK